MRIKYFIELSRPINVLMAIIGVVLGAGLGGSIEWAFVILACIAAATFTAAGNALNDYIDRDLDRIIHPDRPIPSGKISPREAYMYAVSMFVLSAIFASVLAYFKPLTLLVYAPVLAFMLMYELKLRLKYYGPIGNVLIASLVGATFSYGALASKPNNLAFMLTLYAFLSNWTREIVKDLEDLPGDKAAGRKTLPMIIGEDLCKKISLIPLIVAVVTSPIPYAIGNMDIIPFVILLVGDCIFIYSMALTLKKQYKMAQKTMKYGMLVILVAYFIQLLIILL
ncbi:MAG: geranylgeranylglycerol-phosphate geranylgeranyltransferase [Euryarchaeota archaeon]|nr:geranylgeranylglycerol-phosphate geranylgeranyltransferase [Euryarchaeota archaeon]